MCHVLSGQLVDSKFQKEETWWAHNFVGLGFFKKQNFNHESKMMKSRGSGVK